MIDKEVVAISGFLASVDLEDGEKRARLLQRVQGVLSKVCVCEAARPWRAFSEARLPLFGRRGWALWHALDNMPLECTLVVMAACDDRLTLPFIALPIKRRVCKVSTENISAPRQS